MTKIRLITNEDRSFILDMDGHAKSGPYGSDIVCAAESMLSQALLQTLFDMQEESGWLKVDCTGVAEGGRMRISGKTYRQDVHDAVASCLRMAMTGFRMLEEKYPDHIKVTEG